MVFTALDRCGFEDIKHEVINIPDDLRLELRYREKIGSVLFDVFIAKKSEKIPNIELLQKAFDVAHDNRKLEIGLFWQRSLFFWGFLASALVGYGTTFGKSSILPMVLALFGFVCSVVWAAGNRGSKYWQEYWENKVNFYQHYTTGNIFYDRTPNHPNIWENYAARRISVSKLTMALSDDMVCLWFILCLVSVNENGHFIKIPIWLHQNGILILFIITLVYCFYFLRYSKSED